MSTFDYLDDLDEAVQESYQGVSEKEESIVQSNENGNGFGDVYSQTESSGSEPYQPQKMNARHREIIRLHALGYKGTEIAGVVGCTPQLVYMTVNSPMGESFLNEIEGARTSSVQDVRQRLQEMSPFAAEVMLDIMNNSSKDSNRLKAAIKTLEMTGQKPGDTHNHNHVHLTKDDIENIKKEHAGGPPVAEGEEVSQTEFNESNKQITQANKPQEDAEHIPTNSKNGTGKDRSGEGATPDSPS